jgi:site-specific recombinase XerD
MAIKKVGLSRLESSLISTDEYNKLDLFLKNKRDNLIFTILYELGISVSELVNLKVSQISFNKNQIEFSNRVISFSKAISDKIMAYMSEFSPSKFLFFTRQSQQITSRRVQQLLKDISSLLGKKITPSLLRKQAIAKTISVKGIEETKEYFGLKHLSKKDYISLSEYIEIQKSLESKRDSLLVSILYETGITLSQLSSLKTSDFDFKNLLLKVYNDERFKLSGKFRSIQINALLAKELIRWIEKNEIKTYLFSSRQADKISERRIEQILNYYSQKSGIRITPEILRNTYIANEISKNGISKIVSNLGLNDFRVYEYGQLSFANLDFDSANSNYGGGT